MKNWQKHQIIKAMKINILNQKNVYTILAMVMAFTITTSTKANEVTSELHNIDLVEQGIENVETLLFESEIQPNQFEISDLKEMPRITFIHKYGETIAEFYGEKPDLEKTFDGASKKCQLITISGKHAFYLIF